MKKIYDCPQLDVVKMFVNAPLCDDEKGDNDVNGDFTISGTVDFGNA